MSMHRYHWDYNKLADPTGNTDLNDLQKLFEDLNNCAKRSSLVTFLSHCVSGSRLQKPNDSDGRPPHENLFDLIASEWECASVEKMRCVPHGEGAPA